jgi:hypothetical protein
MQFVPDWRGLGGKEATGDVEKVVFVTIQMTTGRMNRL